VLDLETAVIVRFVISDSFDIGMGRPDRSSVLRESGPGAAHSGVQWGAHPGSQSVGQSRSAPRRD
jgi:hypothetical protein